MWTIPSLKGFKGRKESYSIIVITLVLSGFITFLLITNYKSQKEVQKSVRDQLKHGMEKMAISSSYFFSERKNDFKNLSTCRELSTFFDNKALGMSMEYGLRASLLAIYRNFNQLLKDRQLNNDRIYNQIIFIDKSGKLLVDTLQGNREQTNEREWERLLNQETQYTKIIITHEKESSEIMISTPYFFKNSYEGQIVGWINLETIYKNFIKSMEISTKKLVFFVCDKGHLHLDKDKKLNIDSSYIANLVKRKTDGPHILEVVNNDNQKEKILALWIQVKDTPFFLMTIVPFTQVFGHTGPWNLFLVMAALSIVIIGGTVILMRINAHNLVLRTRLEETAKRESDIEEKNIVLNKEITERKLMEMRLRNNEKYLKLIFDSIQSGIMLIDYESHRIIDINQAALKMINSPKKKLLGFLCHKNICPSEIGKCPITDLGQAVDTKECILIDSKANEIPIIKNASSITIKKQRYILESFTDISEYKKAEIALKENEERFRSLAEAAPFGLSIVKIDKTFEYFNPKFTEIFGYALKDLPDKQSWFRKAYPDEEYRNDVINIWKEDVTQSQKKGEIPSRTFTVRCKNGQDKQIRFKAVVLKDGKQILTYEDITLQKKMEQDLKESEEKYRNLVENIQDGVFLVQNGEIKFANEAFSRIIGYGPNEIIGMDFQQLIPLEELILLEDHDCQENTARYKTKEFELSLVKKDKITKVIVNVNAGYFHLQGKSTIIGIMKDITERKEAEEQIRASLKEKEVLLKEIHHRVKNNMQIISSLLHLQSEGCKDEEAIDLIKESQERVRSMALIHEKLYQSKELVSIDFKEYIENLTNYLLKSYKVNTNKIVLNVNCEGIFLDIDSAIPCGLIINELVTNSLKYAFPNGGKGEITIGFKKCEKNRIELFVGDNGVGIKKDVDFQNTDSLGLRLVNLFTEQLKGSIELDRNDGTKFKITFLRT